MPSPDLDQAAALAALKTLIPDDVREEAAPYVEFIAQSFPDLPPATIGEVVLRACGTAAHITGETIPRGTLLVVLFLASELINRDQPNTPGPGHDPAFCVLCLSGGHSSQQPAAGKPAGNLPDADRLIDPDCVAGKCGSCMGGPCQHDCHRNGDPS
jgi:hypothetical protein